MSGGHFNYSYTYLNTFCDSLEEEIKNNNKKNEWGYAPNFKKETIKKLTLILKQARLMSELMCDIEWLYSGDDSEETFLKNIKGKI